MRFNIVLASMSVTLPAVVGAIPGVSPAHADDRIVLFADRDDDDANGTPDAEQSAPPSAAELFEIARPSGVAKAATFALRGDNLRLVVDGKALAESVALPPRAKRLEIQATKPGRGEIEIFGKTIKVGALELIALDGRGARVDLARSHASLERTPPARLADDPFADSADPDALRFVLAGHAEDLPTTLTIFSFDPAGAAIDALSDLPLVHTACPDGVGKNLTCGSTLPIRAVADDIDRRYPLVKNRSIKALLGGALGVVSPRGDKLQMIRVAGPRHSSVGAIERYRAHLRVLMVRLVPHGPPPMGGDDAGAMAVARAEVERTNLLWAACGISFGPPDELDLRIVDPPRSHMLALGCDHGLPASGGAIRVRVDGREVSATLRKGMKPDAAARVVASAINAAGFVTLVSDNPTIGAGAFGSSDVLVRHKDGTLATLEPPQRGTISGDATMSACIGRVDLEDGLQHFGDVDAIAGTIEERALIKAFDDGDPSTIEVIMIPSFAGGGRIGESFIFADRGAIRNTLIEDRAGIRADRASFALAHELGHVLLDDPGHPDDFGVDTPTRLMDADAANASAYGPRRLLVEECARAVRQSGPASATSLLVPWPLRALGREAKHR